MSARASVFVEAAARLHFGVLDLRGALGRRFGGLGAAVPQPSLLLEVERDERLSAHGPDGERAAAFERLQPPPEREVERVAHLVLMQLLPALVEGDLASFGAALTEVQRVTGAWFAPQQGGVFAPGPTATLIRRMADWGAAGVGQSSWGPAAYGLVGS